MSHKIQQISQTILIYSNSLNQIHYSNNNNLITQSRHCLCLLLLIKAQIMHSQSPRNKMLKLNQFSQRFLIKILTKKCHNNNNNNKRKMIIELS